MRLNRLALIFILAVCTLILDAWIITPASRQEAAQYLDESIALAAATYGTCRLVNAGVSVLQESNVSFTPLGMGLELHPGQMLDPINDATERLSAMSVSAMGVLGAQRLVLTTATDFLAPVFWTLIALTACVAWRWRRAWPTFSRLLLAVAMIKLSIPLMCWVGIQSNQHYFDPHINTQLHSLDAVRDHASKQYDNALFDQGLASPSQTPQSSWYDVGAMVRPLLQKIQALWRQTQAVYQSTTAAMSYLIDHFDEILGSFGALFVLLIEKIIIQVLVLPLTTLWLIRLAHRWIFR